MTAYHCKLPAVADWHSASKLVEDAALERLAQVLLGAARSVDQRADWLVDTSVNELRGTGDIPFFEGALVEGWGGETPVRQRRVLIW